MGFFRKECRLRRNVADGLLELCQRSLFERGLHEEGLCDIAGGQPLRLRLRAFLAAAGDPDRISSPGGSGVSAKAVLEPLLRNPRVF